MKTIKNQLSKINTRVGFFVLLVILTWMKTLFAYAMDYHLSLEKIVQYTILIFNPLASTLFFLGIALYIRHKKASYFTMLTIFGVLSLLLYANAIYYREFSDFITVNTVLGAKQVSSGLGSSALQLLRIHDIFYWADFLSLIVLLAIKKIKMEAAPVRGRQAILVTLIALGAFAINLNVAETDRPDLLKRTFSSDYMVRYLGVPVFTINDALKTYQVEQVRAQASPNDLDAVKDYVENHTLSATDEYFGLAKGKNVIYLHLESFQQFLIDYKVKDENGVEHEATPFLNSIYHANSTISFDNFFHQVGAGKTSDCETMLENSVFGLPQGSLFSQLGGTNTFQAAPAILGQKENYSSAVFHGNIGNFWNRNETYKHLGYEHFFDSTYFNLTPETTLQFGLQDKEMFQQSIPYLERLQQPFYAKYVTVSNHFPFDELTNGNEGFPTPNTDDKTINGYFATANYLDSAIEEFFNYLKASGLYENTMVILYGDHFGIANSRNTTLAPLLNKNPLVWNNYDNAMLQRVPFMIHIPGYTNGGINHTYAGQIDAMPTIMHLLGVDTTGFVELGQDLLNPERNQVVAFRDGRFVTPKYTVIGTEIYDTKTGNRIGLPTQEMSREIESTREQVKTQLAVSDSVTNNDLLRFNNVEGFTPIKPNDYVYQNGKEQLEVIEKEKGEKSTSVFSQHGGKSTSDLYKVRNYQEIHGGKQ